MAVNVLIKHVVHSLFKLHFNVKTACVLPENAALLIKKVFLLD